MASNTAFPFRSAPSVAWPGTLKSHISVERTTPRLKLTTRQLALIVVAASLNFGLLLYLQFTEGPVSYALLALCGFFWATTLLCPQVMSLSDLMNPKNYMYFLFFTSMVSGPILMYVEPRRSVAESINPKVWDYIGTTAAIWIVSFLAYGLTYEWLRRHTQVHALNEVRIVQEKQAGSWMVGVGLLYVFVGILGMLLLAGSFGSLLAIGGVRSTARQFAVEGTYRYLVWIEATPIGSAFLLLYLLRRWKLNAISGLLLLAALYLPLVPFYAYNAGRARTLLPLFFLLCVYYRHCHRFSLLTVLSVLAGLLPLMAAWSLHRKGLVDYSIEPQHYLGVLGGDFGRFDVTALAISGFAGGGLDFYYGETLLPCLKALFVSGDVVSKASGGTAAMAQAIFGTRNLAWDSTLATPLVLEGYLNFAWAGAVAFMVVLAWVVQSLERWREDGGDVALVGSVFVLTKLPFLAALEITLPRLIWTALPPVLFALAIERLARRSR